MLIVSVKTLDTQKLLQAQASGDGVEIRIDQLSSFSLWEIAKARKLIHKPLIFTLRRKCQGGLFSLDERSWYELIKSLSSLHPDFIDIDYQISPLYLETLASRFTSINWILSYHEMQAKLSLESVLNLMPEGFIYKIVTKAQSSLDALKVLAFLKKQQGSSLKISCLASGEKGSLTRILSPVYGGYMNYCSLSEMAKTAEGQISAYDLKKIYHYSLLNPNTAVFALIGDPVDKSPGHLFHNFHFCEQELNAVYVKIPLQEKELPSFFSLAKELGFQGLSVTMPLKEKVFPFVHPCDACAQATHAINTIVLKEELFGYNTDGIGAIDALEKRVCLSQKRVLILGAGGSAKAIAYEVKKRGAQVLLTNRSKEKAVQVADLLQLTFIDKERVRKEDFDILINCTPEESPLQEDQLPDGAIVFDILHTRTSSPFLEKAKEKGCLVIHGQEMFENQAKRQSSIWKEQSALSFL